MQLITENDKNRRLRILMNVLSILKFANIKEFQKANGLEADGLFGLKSYLKLYEKLLKLIKLPDFAGHYHNESYPKKTIIWHHSAGWDDSRGMFNWWKVDGVQHVATSIGITDDGAITQGFDEQYWAHHIGLQHWNNLMLNQQAIAVEVCNWGCLTKKGNKYVSWAGAEVPANKVIQLNYKGYQYYEAYTEKEIEALKIWTLLNAMRFDIPLTYREKDMWEVSKDAISGVAGIYTHNSFVSWKSDVSPQPKLIAMAKDLVAWEK